MSPGNDNNLYAAFYLYVNYRLLQYGVAFQNMTTRLYPTVDRSLPSGFQGYSSPLKGWVYDGGVTGAVIINSISGGGYSAPLTRASGLHFDYINGRVLVPTSLGTNLTLTGTAAMCEVNTYLPNETEDPMITQGKYFVNPRFVFPLTTGAPPGVYATPAIFINSLGSKNEAFTFGGLIRTKNTFSITVFAETNYQLNTILGIFRDSRYGCFPMTNTIEVPLDGWNDLKQGSGFNYVTFCQSWGLAGNLVNIDEVYTSKVSDRVKMNPQLFCGVIDMDVSFVRQAPVTTNIFV